MAHDLAALELPADRLLGVHECLCDSVGHHLEVGKPRPEAVDQPGRLVRVQRPHEDAHDPLHCRPAA
eukprot:10914769-Alexandrium_andersonii.AAC.1